MINKNFAYLTPFIAYPIRVLRESCEQNDYYLTQNFTAKDKDKITHFFKSRM